MNTEEIIKEIMVQLRTANHAYMSGDDEQGDYESKYAENKLHQLTQQVKEEERKKQQRTTTELRQLLAWVVQESGGKVNVSELTMLHFMPESYEFVVEENIGKGGVTAKVRLLNEISQPKKEQ